MAEGELFLASALTEPGAQVSHDGGVTGGALHQLAEHVGLLSLELTFHGNSDRARRAVTYEALFIDTRNRPLRADLFAPSQVESDSVDGEETA